MFRASSRQQQPGVRGVSWLRQTEAALSDWRRTVILGVHAAGALDHVGVPSTIGAHGENGVRARDVNEILRAERGSDGVIHSIGAASGVVQPGRDGSRPGANY